MHSDALLETDKMKIKKQLKQQLLTSMLTAGTLIPTSVPGVYRCTLTISSAKSKTGYRGGMLVRVNPINNRESGK